MRPVSFSATALQTAGECMSRYVAENYHKGSSFSNSAADVGTAVHGALEYFVTKVFLEKVADWSDKMLLIDLYKISYMETFNTADTDTDEFADGYALVMKWYQRTSFEGVEVLSCEVKSNFPVKTTIGDIPFNYIWDRCDRLDESTIKVVDYKTIRKYLNGSNLKKMVQPRAYALAAQFQFPEVKKIWVEYDMLRQDSPVGALFTTEDNKAFYKYLKAEAQRIIETDESDAPERLNPNCAWCIKKVSCPTLASNVKVGGIMSLTPDEIAEKRMMVASQIKALEYLDKDLDAALLQVSEKDGIFEWDTNNGHHVEVTASYRRSPDMREIIRIIGPDLTQEYGSITLGVVDKLMKMPDVLDDVQKKEIERLLKVKKYGEPTTKVTPMSAIDEG